MDNFKNNQDPKTFHVIGGRNETPAPSLEGVERKISMLTQHNNTAAPDGFRERLKAQVLAAHAQNNMRRIFSFKDWLGFFKVSRLTVAIAAVLLVAVVGGVLLQSFLPGSGKLARVFINPAYAADDFSLVPLAADAAGVMPDAVYKLTSKESFSLAAIKTGLSFSPDIKAEVTQVNDKEWMIKPTVSLPANTLLHISLAAEVNDGGTALARDFAWAFQVKDNFRVLNTLPGNAAKNVPTDTGIEVTFSHADLADYEKAFSISPSVAGKFEFHGRTAVFVPAARLAAGELYTVTIAGQLSPSGSGQKLGDAYVFSFETAAAEDNSQNTWFGVNSAMLQFTPDENPFIQVYGDVTERTSVTLYSFPSFDGFRQALAVRDAYPRWSEKWNNYRYDTSKLNRALTFSPKIETENNTTLIPFPSRLPVGFYLAEVSYRGKVASVMIEVNDLNIVYNVDATRVLVWANRPSDGAALAGAAVSAGPLVTGMKTDANGVAAFNVPASYRPAPPNYTEQSPIYMTVASGDTTMLVELNFGWPSNVSRWSYFYTDRPRYQSDDTLQFWAMTRDRNDLSVMSGKYSVVLRKSGWYDYFYNPVKIAEVAVTPDAYGTVTGAIKLAGLRPDSYEVALTLDGKDVATRNVSVLPYVKPAYSISVTADRSALFFGEQVKFTAEAKFFDGTPAVGLGLRVVTDNNSPLGSFTTDDQGKITFSDTRPYDQNNFWTLNTTYTVSPEAAELGEISGATTVSWYVSHYYTNADVTYPAIGQASLDFHVRKLDMNKLNNQGVAAAWSWSDDWRGSEPAAGAAITANIYKMTYERVETGTAYDFINKTSYKTYRYDQHEAKLPPVSLVAGADGHARYSLGTEKSASYRVEYSVADMAGREERGMFYAYYFDGAIYYSDYNPGWGDNQTTIELNREDSTYSLGEKVKATLISGGKPVLSGGANRFLFAKYQNGLKSWQVQNGSVYNFAFAEADIPNVQIFAAWWDGKTYHTTQTDSWSGGADTGAIYRYADRALTISASLDKSAYAPGAPASLKLTVKDKDGRPVRAAVNVNLVDEAYYAVASDTADPLSSIYARQPSGLYYSEQSQTLSPLAMKSGAERGGCFLAGTMITMADGTTKPIEQVTIGEKVSTLANPLSNDAATGTVSAVFEHSANKLISINNGLLVATPEHMIYASGEFKTAGELRSGDVMAGLNGKKITVQKTEVVFKKVTVYNLRVDPYHTFIANGIYVHNDKDAPVRQKFVDTALFRTIETDANGYAALDLVLPDNVTTWRLTTQALGKNLSAGVSVNKIKATLPAFVDVAVGSEYLAGDQVIAKLRAYGVAFSPNDDVSYTVAAPKMGDAPFQYQVNGKAYAPTEVAFPPLPVGNYDVTYSMSSAKGKDAVKLPLAAVKSFMTADQILSTSAVLPGTVFTAPGAGETVRVIFADGSTMRYYQMLSGLSWSYGKRVDQALAHSFASDLLLKYYNEAGHENAFDGTLYQQADGGIALLPYGGSDMDLSARLAALAPSKFDKAALRQYFLREIDAQAATPDTVSQALLGLASLGDPVLPRLEAWKTRTDLSDEARLRTTLALEKMGAAEEARQMYNDLVKKAEARGEYYLFSGANNVSTLEKTAFLSELAAALNMPERDRLWSYVRDHENNADVRGEVLANLEELAYATYALPSVAPGPSSVVYELNGAKDQINLNGWGDKSISLSAADLPKLKITAVEGKVSAEVVADVAFESSGVIPSREVSITRNYTVADKTTAEFRDGDLVRVDLGVTISAKSPSNNYQVTDLLPAGLTAMTNVYDQYSGNGYSWLNPFEINGQKVSFNLWKSSPPDKHGNYTYSIYYYARVKTKGTYKAEPAVVQGFQDPTTINFSAAQTVSIK